MPSVTIENIPINVDLVLRAQGIDPEQLHGKHTKLIELTSRAIEVGYIHLDPQAVFETFSVLEVKHNCITLANGKFLSGDLIGRHLAAANKVALAVCTVGPRIGEFTSDLFGKDPALAMAVEGLGAAATEVLANLVCHQINQLALSEGLMTSLPINPGMVGWPVEEGQPQIFACLDAESIGVELLYSSVMKPLKSLSMAVGFGNHFDQNLTTCDFCGLAKTCAHKPSMPVAG